MLNFILLAIALALLATFTVVLCADEKEKSPKVVQLQSSQKPHLPPNVKVMSIKNLPSARSDKATPKAASKVAHSKTVTSKLLSSETNKSTTIGSSEHPSQVKSTGSGR